jgi:putative transposase
MPGRRKDLRPKTGIDAPSPDKYNPTQSFQCPQHFSVDFENNTIYIPKVKNIKAKLHRKFEGLIKTITISKHNNKYYASILVDDAKLIPEKLDLEKENSIGLDLGLKHFVITSDGDKYDNPKYLRKSEINEKAWFRSDPDFLIDDSNFL